MFDRGACADLNVQSNKIWQATKYCVGKFEEGFVPESSPTSGAAATTSNGEAEGALSSRLNGTTLNGKDASTAEPQTKGGDRHHHIRSLPERWVLSRMNHAVKRINEQLESREFSAAAQSLYGFILDCFCDVFIENSKALLEGGTGVERTSGEFSPLSVDTHTD